MITHVAIFAYGKVWALPKPKRHHDVIYHIAAELKLTQAVEHNPLDQGFLDDKGRFLRRRAALVQADKCGQLDWRRKTQPDDILFSEDLW